MDKEIFKTIEDNLNVRVTWCKDNLAHIKGPDDFKQLSIMQYNKLIDECKDMQSQMDKIYCEFRHLITMGNLTVRQQSSLCSLMREFSNYRTDIKIIAGKNKISIPDLPTVSTYKLSLLGNITLTSKPRGERYFIVSEDDIENEVKAEDKQNNETIGSYELVKIADGRYELLFDNNEEAARLTDKQLNLVLRHAVKRDGSCTLWRKVREPQHKCYGLEWTLDEKVNKYKTLLNVSDKMQEKIVLAFMVSLKK